MGVGKAGGRNEWIPFFERLPFFQFNWNLLGTCREIRAYLELCKLGANGLSKCYGNRGSKCFPEFSTWVNKLAEICYIVIENRDCVRSAYEITAIILWNFPMF